MNIAINEKTKKILSVIFTTLLGVATLLFIITFSIGLPIYCRFFYYLQIEPLNLVEETGRTYEQIKTAYDEMLNYLTLPGTTFSTGVFKFTEEGAAHFADCKGLFTLNTVTLIISTVIIVLTLILDKFKVIALYRIKGLSVTFFSAVSIFVIGIILGVAVAIDFDSAFTVFHKVFFPGKDNWHFHPYYDQIITALPAEFFLNCAILIGASIILISVGIIIFQLIKKKRLSK